MLKKLKKAINILQWLLTIVLISVVLLLIFTAFNPVKSFQVLRVMSGSMEPKIKVGSIVFVQKVKPEILKENDVITYTSLEDSNISITHRLIAIEEKEGKTVFKTQGDANNSEDIDEVSPSQIKGKVVFSLPFLGYLSVWIRKPLGFGLLVILPALLIVISEILNIKKTIEKEVEKKYAKLEKHKKKPPANLLFIFFLIGVGFSQIKATNTFFSDVMLAEGNTFTAARLDFSLSSPPDFSPSPIYPYPSLSNSSSRQISLIQESDLDFQYDFQVSQISGHLGFCQALQLEVQLDGVIQYTGSLFSFNLSPTIVTGGQDDWEFILSFSDDDPDLQMKTCNFEIRFDAWQLNSDGTWGFIDQEIIVNSINSGDWNGPIISNIDITPNPTNISPAITVNLDDNFSNIQSANYSLYYGLPSDPNPPLVLDYDQIALSAQDGAFDSQHEILDFELNINSLADDYYSLYLLAFDIYHNLGSHIPVAFIIDTVPSQTILTTANGKTISETIINGGFELELADWDYQGETTTTSITTVYSNPQSGSSMAQISGPSSGENIWNNQLSQTIEGESKNLSFYYNLATKDYGDNPAFSVKLNNQTILSVDSLTATTPCGPDAWCSGWTQASFDLVSLGISYPFELVFNAGNTDNSLDDSWVYLDEITTNLSFTASSAQVKLDPFDPDPSSGIASSRYSWDGSSWVSYSLNSTINLSDHGVLDQLFALWYHSDDNAGNSEPDQIAYFFFDDTSPDNPTVFTATAISDTQINLDWLAPASPASVYDLRFSINEILSEDDFNLAVKLPDPPPPGAPGSQDVYQVLGLNPGTTYYFALKAGDSVPNWSSFVTASATTP